MNSVDARRFMLAAKDDAILAAWTSVFHEHRMITAFQASPYEAWDAYQDLYNYDLVTAEEFNCASWRSFSSSQPPISEIQNALDNLEFLCPEQHLKEIAMKNNTNPFATTENSLATREERKPSPAPLAGRQAGALSNPFAASNEIAAPPRRGGELGLGAFGGAPSTPIATGLACQSPAEMPAVECDGPEMWCSGPFGAPHPRTQILLVEDKPHGMDGEPEISGELLMTIFSGTCESCGLIYHTSASRMADPGAFR